MTQKTGLAKMVVVVLGGASMKFLHFCGGDKGGVGKTFFAKFLINYYTTSNFPLIIYETDRSNLDIIRAFPSEVHSDSQLSVKTAFFSDNPSLKDAPDAIIDDIITGNADIIVNLPAGSSVYFFEWWDGSGAGELVKEADVKVVYWFLLAAEQIERLQKFLTRSDLDTVIVCNLYLQQDWDNIINLIQSKVSNLGIDPNTLKFIKLAHLSQSVANLLAKKRWSVSAAFQQQGQDKLKLLESKRLEIYAKNFNDLVRSTGLVRVDHHH
jgi:hypothetical protein